MGYYFTNNANFYEQCSHQDFCYRIFAHSQKTNANIYRAWKLFFGSSIQLHLSVFTYEYQTNPLKYEGYMTILTSSHLSVL